MKDWIDKLDRKIFPFVEYPGYEARYPAIEGLHKSAEKAHGFSRAEYVNETLWN